MDAVSVYGGGIVVRFSGSQEEIEQQAADFERAIKATYRKALETQCGCKFRSQDFDAWFDQTGRKIELPRF